MWGTLTVLDAINEHDGEYIKVGFGTSFVYCDTANDDAKDAIDDAGRAWLLRSKKKLRNRRCCRDEIMRKGIEAYIQEQYLKEMKKEALRAWTSSREPKPVDIEFIRNRTNKYIYRLNTDIKGYEQRIASYRPFLDLEVTEEYPSCAEDGCTIIVADHGLQVQGMFWDREEYRRFKSNGEMPNDEDDKEDSE